MRVSTAATLALTALLTTSLLGVIAVTPAVSTSAPDHLESVDDRSHPSALATVQPSEPSSQSDSPPTLEPTDPKQVIRITIDDTGDATWTIESRFLLTDEEDEAAFREYADAVTSGERDVGYSVQQFDWYRQEAQESTGRDMTFKNSGWDDPRIVSPDEVETNEGVRIEADESGSTRIGVISYSFTWTNFATVDGDRIYFGDAFEIDSGVWLSLTDDQRLVIESPSGYALETPTTLEWNGPYQFSDGELEIVFVRSADGAALGLSGWTIAAVFGLVVIVAVGSYLLARREQETELPAAIERVPGRIRTGANSLVDRLSGGFARDRVASRTTDTDGGSVDSNRGSNTGDETADASDISEPGTELEFVEEDEGAIDPELLSDEERVIRLLKRNGGRMKQGSIVTETGWSNAKVSQLLSQMDEDGEIEKLRIGRENLITLPEVDPTKLD